MRYFILKVIWNWNKKKKDKKLKFWKDLNVVVTACMKD